MSVVDLVFNMLSIGDEINLKKSVFIATWWQVIVSMVLALLIILAHHQKVFINNLILALNILKYT